MGTAIICIVSYLIVLSIAYIFIRNASENDKRIEEEIKNWENNKNESSNRD